jgi:hypothetical protein
MTGLKAIAISIVIAIQLLSFFPGLSYILTWLILPGGPEGVTGKLKA